ncbi:chromosome segregation protein Csm1/Pcs1-domain-containing protein [Chaetomidium leptoderma]|uniref:Chromosome segregation protein Csm1/Pcs1-domain-containing protein n=1 Tax=Chaetomidium leptoderma TaxID=669021 RepID=A0AAN7A0S4_9PEZI|nr:chromosome segregation protein Csm1/Pcs1-domain-containing protein [Chaetomidium leptoderma]
MSKTKIRSRLLQLVDSDSEDGIGRNSLDAQHSKTTNPTSTMPPKKGKAGRQAANRVTKPAPKTSTSKHRSSNRIAAAAEEVTANNATAGAPTKGRGRGRKRTAAAEEEEEEEDTVMTEAQDPAITAPPATKKKGGRGRPKKVAVEPEPQPAAARRGRKPAGKKSEPEEEVSEIPETQQPDATLSDIDDDDVDDLADLPVSRTPERAKTGRGSAPVPSSVSKRPLHSLSPDKGDPALRRRLGEMAQKYESLEHKYRDLKEIAVREAERNFDKLKKQSEERSKAADQLIATLKAEVAAQKEASKGIQRLEKQLDASESKAETLQTKLTDLTTSLSESKSEIKSLNLKLSAARNAEAAAKVPGSAMKGSTGASRLAAVNASEATVAAQRKENLYGDLTGLIVRSVKRVGSEDVFDCIQTGRNGTLHFKLAVDIDPEEGEAHCHYTPQLDSNRDRALIDVLPGYLVDEISFPQTQAGKFYARVLKALNETPEE